MKYGAALAVHQAPSTKHQVIALRKLPVIMLVTSTATSSRAGSDGSAFAYLREVVELASGDLANPGRNAPCLQDLRS